MKIIHTELPGVIVFEPKIFQDSRGYFTELFQQARYEAAGLNFAFVQDNLSLSSKGTLRGLHYQLPHAQGKLVTVIQGGVQDIVVDIRQASAFYSMPKHIVRFISRPDLPMDFAHWKTTPFSFTNARILITLKRKKAFYGVIPI